MFYVEKAAKTVSACVSSPACWWKLWWFLSGFLAELDFTWNGFHYVFGVNLNLLFFKCDFNFLFSMNDSVCVSV